MQKKKKLYMQYRECILDAGENDVEGESLYLSCVDRWLNEVRHSKIGIQKLIEEQNNGDNQDLYEDKT